MTDKEFIEKWRVWINEGDADASDYGDALTEALDRLEAAQPAEDGLRRALEEIQALLNNTATNYHVLRQLKVVVDAALAGHAPKVAEGEKK